MGVTGIRLNSGDEVVEMAVIRSGEGSILTISQNGYGKKTAVDDYRLQGRSGSGILSMKLTDKTGSIAGVRYVVGDISVLIISQKGKLIRFDLGETRDIGRVTQGVRLIHLDDPEDRVVGIGILPPEEVEEDVEVTDSVSDTDVVDVETQSENQDTDQSDETEIAPS